MITLLILLSAAPFGHAETSGESKRPALAGTVVRSKEYVVRRSPAVTEEFIGDVSYRQEGRRLRADWALHERDKGLWQMRGNIKTETLLKSGGVIEAEGDRAHYDLNRQNGWLRAEKNPRVRYLYRAFPSPGDPPIPDPLPARPDAIAPSTVRERARGTARALEFDERARTARLVGEVAVVGPEGRAWCDEAQWAETAAQLTLRGNAHVLRSDGEAWADQIVYDSNVKQARLTGRRPVSTYSDSKSQMAIQGDELQIHREPRERLIANGRVEGWIYFTRAAEKGRARENP